MKKAAVIQKILVPVASVLPKKWARRLTKWVLSVLFKKDIFKLLSVLYDSGQCSKSELDMMCCQKYGWPAHYTRSMVIICSNLNLIGSPKTSE